jgi:heptose I phosphotransferase
VVERDWVETGQTKRTDVNSETSGTQSRTAGPYLPLAGEGYGSVHPEWKSVFHDSGLRQIDDFFAVTGTALSKPGLGMRYRARLDLVQNGKRVSVFLKRYAGEPLKSRLQRWFEDGERHAIAFREMHVANALERIGIRTFKPLAWGCRGGWGKQQKSFIVMSQVQGESLERWLPRQTELHSRAGWTRKVQLVEQLADFASRLHRNGWFHRDFYLCHIFIQDRGGSFELALVDLARMFQPRWRANRWRIKDLAQLNFSAPEEFVSRAMRMRFAKHYFGCARLTPAHKAMVRQILRRTERMRRRESRKQAQG